MIDKEIQNRSLLKHPFYQMWSKGELNLNDLQGYSKEYFSMVKTIPKMVGKIEKLTSDPESRRPIEEPQVKNQNILSYGKNLRSD